MLCGELAQHVPAERLRNQLLVYSETEIEPMWAHGTESEEPLVNLNLYVMMRYYLGGGDLVSISLSLFPASQSQPNEPPGIWYQSGGSGYRLPATSIRKRFPYILTAFCTRGSSLFELLVVLRSEFWPRSATRVAVLGTPRAAG